MRLLDRLLGKSGRALHDFSFLGTDMHAHLIPGIDDGAPDMETAVALVRALRGMGYTRLIATPHVMADLYPNTTDIIQTGVQKLQKAVRAAGIDVQITAAAEYLMDEAFGEKIEQGNLLTLAEGQVLVEMSFIAPPPQLFEYLFRLQTAGYRPVLAHPERYEFYRGDMQAFERLVDAGCRLQVNLLSLTDYYGRSVRQTARQLLAAGWVAYLGTDLHHDRHVDRLQALLNDRKTGRLLANYSFQNQNLIP